jgi:FkbM family methyltransferase
MTQLPAGLRALLRRLTKRQFHPPPDMYLRIDKVDAVVDPLKAMQENIQICLNELRRLSSTALPEIQSGVSQRTADCEEKIERSLVSTNERSGQISRRDEAAPGGVTADDVIASIEMILGWTPDQALVDYHLKLGFADRFALGKYMINTDESRTKFIGRLRNHTFLGDRVLAFTHRGDMIYLDPTDLDLTPGILLNGRHEPHVEHAIVASIRSGDTVIDLGANVGYHTLAIAAAVGPAGHVHAFEANPKVMRLLKATMTVNRFSDFRGTGRVNLYESAVLDGPGTITLASAPDHQGSGHVINTPLSDYGPDYSTRTVVPAVTLDAVLADSVGMVDLIHMDIEGSEPLAVRGAQAIIERSPKIKIITEWSTGMMSTRADVGEFVAWLIERGFKFWLVAEAGLTRLEPSALLTLPHCDLFLSREDPPVGLQAPTVGTNRQDNDEPTEWELRAQQARDRRNRMLSFGPNACGLLVTTKYGLFAVDPEDGGVSAILLHEGSYSEPEYMLAKSLVSPEGDVLIVGAHIGAHAVPLSKHCSNLVAIEANPHTYKYLKTNLTLNCCSNVVSYNVAAGENVDKIKFLLNTENSGGSKRMPISVQSHYVYDDPDVIEVDTIPLDTLPDQRVFDLILMDIEGSEYFALKGMQRILSEAKALSVEFLPHHLICVAGIQVDAFLGTILPHFNWMYVPRHNRVVPKNEILEYIREIYRANEGHEGIYFLKEISPEWLESRG